MAGHVDGSGNGENTKTGESVHKYLVHLPCLLSVPYGLKFCSCKIETIEDLASSPANNNPTLNLKLSILQTDLSRTQYLVRSLLRQRLAKLTKHSMFYLQLISGEVYAQSQLQTQQTDPEQRPEDSVPHPTTDPTPTPLSSQEASFLHSHQSLLATHFGTSFLNSFPPQMRRLDDNAGGAIMVQAPDSKEAVFVRCLTEQVKIITPQGDGIEDEVEGTTMRMGDIWVARWEGVKGAWERGQVEVL